MDEVTRVRVFLTGASGFVGSNLRRGASRRTAPRCSRPATPSVDITDRDGVLRSRRARARTRSCTARSWNELAGSARPPPRVGRVRGGDAERRSPPEPPWC